MNIKIKELNEKDHKKAIEYAIVGMHFNRYFDHKFLLYLYGRYFWYLELSKATQIISVYDDDKLIGVLLAEMNGEEIKYNSFWKSVYVKLFSSLQKMFATAVGVYDEANEKMLNDYQKSNHPDGEIRFLAVNPDIKGKGIGSLLLSELERRETGKQVYLFTDDQCTYEFYERKGFEKAGEQDILLDLKVKKVPLKCFLYSKILGL